MTEQEWLASEDPQQMLMYSKHPDPTGLTAQPQAFSDRKLRLFACACVRQVWHLLTDDVPCPYCKDAYFDVGDLGEPMMGGKEPYASRAKAYFRGHCSCGGIGRINRSHRAVEVAERYADGQATWDELEKAAIEDAIATVHLHGWAGEPFLQDATQAAIYSSRYFATARDARVLPATQAHLLRDIFGNPWRPIALPWAEFGGPMGTERLPGQHWLTPLVRTMASTIYDEHRFEDCPILADALSDAGCDNMDILTHLRSGNSHIPGCWAVDLLLGKD